MHNFVIKLSTLVCLVYVGLGVSGVYSDISVYIRLGLLLFWIVLVSGESRNSISKMINDRTSLGLLIHLILYLFLLLISASVTSTLKLFLSRLLIYSPVLIMAYYKDKPENKKVLVFSMLIWIYYCIKAGIFYFIYPRAARGLAANRTLYGGITLGGGYNLAFGAALVAVLFLDLVLSRRLEKRNFRFLLRFSTVLLLVTNVYLVINTSSVVTLLAMLVGIIISLWLNFFDGKSERNKLFIYLVGWVIVILLFVWVIANYNAIGQMIMSYTNGKSDIVSRRIYEIGLSMSGYNYSGTDFSGRIDKLLSSVSVFFSYPILGSGVEYGFDYISSLNYGVGGHSELVDILALYGIVGGLPLLICHINNIRNIFYYSNRIIKGSFLITFVILFVFNPFSTFQSNFAFFYLLPSALLGISNQYWEVVQDE